MQKTNWPAFGIGMAAGVALSFVLYFGWNLVHPQRPETANGIVEATANAPVGIDENALIAANAERPTSNVVSPPPQLRPEPGSEAEPHVLLEPPAVRPRPRPEPVDEPPEDFGPDDDFGDKPDY